MSYIHYKNGIYNYQLTFKSPLNLVTGLSSTGKTTLINEINKYRDMIKSDCYIITNPDVVMLDLAPQNSMLILDSENYSKPDVFVKLNKLNRNDIVILVLGRRYLNYLPFAVQNVFKLEIVKGVTKNVPMYPNLYQTSFTNFSKVVVEDSKSGYNFFKEIFKNTDTADGNANILKHIKKDNLLVFDTVGFGAYMDKFINLVKNTPGVSYLGWPCFEGFILENVFNKVLDIPYAMNIENAMFEQLKEINPSYSKTDGCTGSACSFCELTCRQSSRKLLSSSKYSSLLEYYKESDKITDILIKLNYPVEWSDEIRELLPSYFIDDDAVTDAVIFALKTKGLIN